VTVDQTEPTDWDWVRTSLMMRSGTRCEIRSPACMGITTLTNASAVRLDGYIGHLPDYQRSLHHRRPRGMGGTKRADVDSLAALVNTCGHGTIGCHWYTEYHRDWARARGLLVPNNGSGDAVDAARVPLVLPSGRRVLLDPDHPFYLDPPDGVMYATP